MSGAEEKSKDRGIGTASTKWIHRRANDPITVALICSPDSRAFASAIAALLARETGFKCVRFEYRIGSEFKPHTAEFCVPDVVVAALAECPDTALQIWFESVQRAFPNCPVVVGLTESDRFDLFQVLELGASDFLLPPLRRAELLPRLMRQARATRRSDPLVQKLKEEMGLKQIIGQCPAFLEKVRCVPRFARCDATVLITGESGTGKEIFARAIHYLSPRADYPFVPVNCGALPEHLLESEIFGHKRGAFTGATFDQKGLIREAEGGTLFLDEIDSLSAHAQVKLLRFLQDGEYRPVGSQQVAHANLRVIAATNVDLPQIVRESKFREDLFYRLNVLRLALPALRERRGDIILLTHDFLEKQAVLASTSPKSLSPLALNRLLIHSWPGNVRELQNVLTRAVLLSDDQSIEVADLDLPDEDLDAKEQSFQVLKSHAIRRFEHDFLLTMLRAHDGNITRAAAAAKKNRRAFWELLRKHGLLAGIHRR